MILNIKYYSGNRKLYVEKHKLQSASLGIDLSGYIDKNRYMNGSNIRQLLCKYPNLDIKVISDKGEDKTNLVLLSAIDNDYVSTSDLRKLIKVQVPDGLGYRIDSSLPRQFSENLDL
tara:strand:+ start:185 stop:535 length:351 start_codon:yes stop_codon:yes gene_type:complete